jgi:tyrosinase
LPDYYCGAESGSSLGSAVLSHRRIASLIPTDPRRADGALPFPRIPRNGGERVPFNPIPHTSHVHRTDKEPFRAMTDTSTSTRWARVQEILDAAHPETPVYAGAGRFWAELDTLLAAEIHGVRMVAAASPGCGCGSCGTGSGKSARGAASGLVRGLRGQAPFDGSRLPRLPWGGPRMAEADIQYISDWIDDGAAADGADGTGPVRIEVVGSVETLDRLTVTEPIAARLRAEAGAAYGGGGSGRPEIRQRMNLDCLTESQLEQLRFAFRELYALNKWPRDYRSYNNLALIHQDHCQHGWERFLTWHRVYLYEFEQAMQDVCPGITMPYWDFTMPQYSPAEPYKGWIIPLSFKGYITQAGLEWLRTEAVPRLEPAQASKVEEAFVQPRRLFNSLPHFYRELGALIGEEYATGAYADRFLDALVDGNPLWYPLRFPAEYQDSSGKPQTINQAIHYHYPTAGDMDQILSLRSFRDFGGGGLYNDAFGFLDQNPHNTMHIWTGGMNPEYGRTPAKSSTEALRAASFLERNRTVRVAGRQFHTRGEFYGWRTVQYGDMFSNLTASYDPIFWPIHANIDRVWWEWQQAHPHGLPGDLSAVLTPWGYTAGDTLDISRFGYEYVRCAFPIPVGLEAPVGRFTSKPIDVPETVRGSFRQAEVRLHRVPQLERSCFIRVFLNRPDADANTPPEGPNFGGYLAVFGHGECYGGPGHCAVPGEPRAFDLRPRSHNTPRNHRVDVTRAVQALLDAGATQLQVTLVVIGADYREDAELLRMEGLSLNFLD